MSVSDPASLVVKGFVAPLLLWRGWETNKSEVERLRDFLDYGQSLLNDVEHLALEDFEDLQIDLNSIRTGFLNLQSKPFVLRCSGYKQYAEDLAALKRRVEEVAQRFGQRLNIDTSRKMTTSERYQRKLLRENRQTQRMLEDFKQEIKISVGGASSDTVKDVKKKIEENLRLSADAQDAVTRAKQAEKDLEEQVQHNARLQERLKSARHEVARCQEAVAAAEAKADRCKSLSAELKTELRTLREHVTEARQRLQALGEDLAKSNDRVNDAKARVREIEKEMEKRQKAISATYASLKELRGRSSSRKAAADHKMEEFKNVVGARLQEQVEKNGQLNVKVEKLTIEVQLLQRKLEEARQAVTRHRARLAQLGDPVAVSEELTEARSGRPGRHGKKNEELAARPDQSTTLSAAATAARGAAAAATTHSKPGKSGKHGKHEQMPAPYHTISAEVDRRIQNTPADEHGHPDSSEQAGGSVTVSALEGIVTAKQGEPIQVTRTERWVLAKRCVALLQIYFPDTNLDMVLLLPREAFLRHGHMPTFQEAKPHLRPVLSLADKKKYPMGPGKAVYLSHEQGDHRSKVADAAAAAAAVGGAVAVAMAAAAARAAKAIAERALAAREAADLYATARAFLLENPEFQHIWVSAACMPSRLRKQGWRGAVPSAAGSNMFEHLHPGALLACDAVLVAPLEREGQTSVAELSERYTDLYMYCSSPWKTLEGVIAKLMNSVSFYTFRLGDKLVFVGPYHSYPDEPQPSPLAFSRRSSAPSFFAADNPVGRGGIPSDSPVDRGKTAAKMPLLRMGWHGKPDVSKDQDDDGSWNNGDDDEWDDGGPGVRSTGPTPMASATTASDSSGRGVRGEGGRGDGSRRRGDPGVGGSRMDWVVREALDRLQINGSGSPAERNWTEVLPPCLVLRKAREDVEKHSDARGALKQAICSMSVSIDQAEKFFETWKYIGVLGPWASNDRLAVLNLLLFFVSVTDGFYCPPRPRDFVKRVMDESLVTPGHLDLWMKDLSPDDSTNILRQANAEGRKLSALTIGSSHTAGVGVGAFLRGHPALKELELEWEGVRDLSSIAQAVADHKSLTRLNLTHNEIGPRGAILLANALRQNKSLTELDLRENGLGPRGMKAIADALASNDTMQTLHLQDNSIGDHGVIAMTEALMRNGRLRTVCLDGNKVSEEGAKVICIAIKMNPSLKVLSLSRNALPDGAKRALYDAWSQRETEESLTRSGMFLEQAAEGTATRREGCRNGHPPLEGVFVSTRPGSGTGGGAGRGMTDTRAAGRR